jgi:Spy/CpxP family protein refolding chaperone
MKRLLMIVFAGCAFALAPTMSASAMPAATPYALGGTDEAFIQVKGGHGHGWGHHGGRGHHYGWYRGHHYGSRHHWW